VRRTIEESFGPLDPQYGLVQKTSGSADLA